MVFTYRDGTTVEKTYDKDDVLLIAKMVTFEGAAPNEDHEAAVAWSILQRQFCLRDLVKLPLGNMIESFVQPLNPKWTCHYKGKDTGCRNYLYRDPNSGASRRVNFCDPSAANHLDPSSVDANHACSQSNLKDRDRFRMRKWDEIPYQSREFALRFVMGEIPNPIPGVVDFSESKRSTPAVNKKLRHHRHFAFNYERYGGLSSHFGRGNAFYYQKCAIEAPRSSKAKWSEDWDGTEVMIQPPEGHIPDATIKTPENVARALEVLNPTPVYCGEGVLDPPLFPLQPWIVPIH